MKTSPFVRAHRLHCFIFYTLLVLISINTHLTAVRIGKEDFPESSIAGTHLRALLNENDFRNNLYQLQLDLSNSLKTYKEDLEVKLMTFPPNFAAGYRTEVTNSNPEKGRVQDLLFHLSHHAKLSHALKAVNYQLDHFMELETAVARIVLDLEKNPMDIHIMPPDSIDVIYQSFLPEQCPFYKKKADADWVFQFKKMLTTYINTYNLSDVAFINDKNSVLMKNPYDLLWNDGFAPHIIQNTLFETYGPKQMEIATAMVKHFIQPLMKLMRKIQREHIVRIAHQHVDHDIFLVQLLEEFGFNTSHHMSIEEETRC